MPESPAACPHHEVAIVGGGPAGLPLAVTLSGLLPHYRRVPAFEATYPQLASRLAALPNSLAELDFADLVRQGVSPVEFFRLLHHWTPEFESLAMMPLEFRPGPSADVVLFSREPVGGVWNNVPENLLTLSPAHWMEFAFHPIAQWAAETGRALDPNALIIKRDIVDYYRGIPARFGIGGCLREGCNVTRIAPDPRGFLLEGVTVAEGTPFACTARFVVYAVGQRCVLRKLGVPGEDLPYVTQRYDRPEDFPGQRVLVVGGGRSADWAATELHDAGREVTYVMKQAASNHWRLINDSRERLPYYARIAAILEERSPRLRALYETRVVRFEPGGGVLLCGPAGEQRLQVNHAVLEIGGRVDYRPLAEFPQLRFVDKHDRYRFQCRQMLTRPENCEAADVPGLYAGGYLAQGINNVVVAMHGATYVITGDILQRLGRLPKRRL